MFGVNEINKLKEENERLKERVETLDKMTGIFSARLAHKYKSCLQEIKEIAESYCKTMCNGCTEDCVVKEILQKISEVKNE